MANYTTNLKSWGATGAEYPNNYSYLEDEAPVDDWDNFLNSNVISDLQHLVSVTNERIESDKGTDTGFPSSPETSHLYHDQTNNELSYWEAGTSTWHRLLKADGDTLSGALNFSGNAAQNVGPLTMSASADLDGNDLVDGATTLYDSVNGYFPLSTLEASSVTVTAGTQLTGGGSVSLGGSTTIDLNEGAGSGLDADTLDGNEGVHYLLDVEEDGVSAVSDVTAIDFTGHLNVVDDTDGTITLDPTHNHDSRYILESGDTMGGTLTLSDGSVAASRSWATGNNINHSELADAPSGAHHTRYADSEAVTAVNNDADHGSTASHNYFSGSHTDLTNVNSAAHHTRYSNEEAQDAVGGILNTDFSYDDVNNVISLSNTSVTIAGNTVSLGGSTSVAHGDLSDAPSSAHHSKTSSASELSDVSPDSTSGAHHTRYSDSEARTAVDGSSLGSLTLTGTLALDLSSGSRMALPDRTSDPSANAGDMWYRSDLD